MLFTSYKQQTTSKPSTRYNTQSKFKSNDYNFEMQVRNKNNFNSIHNKSLTFQLSNNH